MSTRTAQRIRKRFPQVHKRIREGTWVLIGIARNGHARIEHAETGKKITVSLSPSCSRNEANLIKIMDRWERGDYRW